MSNIINIEVANLSDVLDLYDQIKIYRSATIDGTYTEITDSSTRIDLNSQDTLYTYVDSSGATTDYYKSSYFNSSSLTESTLSGAILATTTTSQLLSNMEIIITLSADIAALDGSTLGTDQTIIFYTPFIPFYTNVRRVRLEIGSFIRDLSDVTVSLAILEASLMADSLTWVSTTGTFLATARKEWTTCKVSQMLLTNTLNTGGLKSKRLDNLSVTYDASHGSDLLDKILMCLARWEVQLNAAGAGTQGMLSVMKGDLDPDTPPVGRLWEYGPDSPQSPMANQRYRPDGKRRYVKGWFKRGY